MVFKSKVTSKGQITLPAEVRQHLSLVAGENVEFFKTSNGDWQIRAHNVPASAISGRLSGRGATMGDDDAIAAAVMDRDARSRKKNAG